MEFEKQNSLSLKQTLRSIYSSCCNSCDTEEEDEIQKPLQHSEKRRSCCKWLKSEFAKLFSCNHCRNHRRWKSSEFKYDPQSYSLNFEDDDSHLDEFPLRDFCSRLPPSPVKEKSNNGVVSTRVSNWS